MMNHKYHEIEDGEIFIGEEQARISSRRDYNVILGILGFSLTLVSFFYLLSSHRRVISFESHTRELNQTLGFGKIYALGLPDRLHKRDELKLLSLAHGLDFSYVDAVSGQSLSNLSLPHQQNEGESLNRGEIGCWRTHVDTWGQMLQDNVETALIVEDDVDFDIRIREQIQDLLKNLKSLQGLDGSKRWDILWLGVCHELAWDVDERFHQKVFAYDDPTMPNMTHVTGILRNIFDKYNQTSGEKRIIQKSNFAYCTVSYAISRQGAAKLLYGITREIRNTVDMEMRRVILEMPIASYSVLPPIMQQWKIDGGRNSELRDQGKGDRRWNPSHGQSQDIDPNFSARKHLKSFITSF